MSEIEVRDTRVRQRVSLYLAERFPILAHGLLIVSFYSSNQFLAHALTEPGARMHYDLGSLLGYLTILCFFLHLRIFDDHKDYADDCRYFPQRILQRGIVSLAELKILGAIAIGVEIVCSAIRGPAALTSWLAAFAFSLLMFKEFFARDWLKRHFLVYASTHMLIVPLLAMIVYSFSSGRYFWEAPVWYWGYAFVGFFVAFNWEVSRKIRSPDDEIDGVDSYTKLFGTYGAAYLVLLIRVIDTGLVMLIGRHLQLSGWFYGVLIALFLVCTIGFFQYRFQTNRATAKRMEIYAGIYILAFDLALACELGRTHGISISW